MSKSVRLPDYLAAEVERLAKEERRSLVNMVKVLLEQALRINTKLRTKEAIITEPVEVQIQTPTTLRTERRREDDHFKPDFK